MHATIILHLHHEKCVYLLISKIYHISCHSTIEDSQAQSRLQPPIFTIYPFIHRFRFPRPDQGHTPLGFTVYHAIHQSMILRHTKVHKIRLYRNPTFSSLGIPRPCALLQRPPHLVSKPSDNPAQTNTREPTTSWLYGNGKVSLKNIVTPRKSHANDNKRMKYTHACQIQKGNHTCKFIPVSNLVVFA